MLKPLRGTQFNFTHPLARGLKAAWLMNAVGGNRIFDYSRNGNIGTINGATWSGGGLNFDRASSHYVSLPNNFSSLSVGSIAAWIRPTVIDGNNRYIFGAADSGDALSAFGFSVHNSGTGNRVFMLISEGGAVLMQASGSTILSTGAWYNVLFQQTGSGYELYVNGVLETLVFSTGAVSDTHWISATNDIDETRLGHVLIAGASLFYFDGAIDSFQIGRVYSPADVLRLYMDPYDMFEDTISPGPLGEFSITAGLSIPVAMHHYKQMRGC